MMNMTGLPPLWWTRGVSSGLVVFSLLDQENGEILSNSTVRTTRSGSRIDRELADELDRRRAEARAPASPDDWMPAPTVQRATQACSATSTGGCSASQAAYAARSGAPY
jgi:hypothetical protein